MVGEISGFKGDGVILTDGRGVSCDIAALAIDGGHVTCPFLPPRYRVLLDDTP